MAACVSLEKGLAGRLATLWRGILVLILATVPSLARAAEQQPVGPGDGSNLTISLLTMGPGPLIYEQFGHNAILVEDSATNSKIAYNYGIFDFDQQGFIGRFIQGKMLYWMEPEDAQRMVAAYAQADRTIWVDELNLAPAQRKELADFLAWNARDENKYYIYNYYVDNCSTRVRDALDRVLDGSVKQQLSAIDAGVSWRWHTRRIVQSDIPMYTALVYILGQPVDHQLSAWEEGFLPLKLRERLRSVTVADQAGNQVPLVKRQRTLYVSRSYSSPQTPPSYLPGYIAAGVLIVVVLLALGWLARRHWSGRLGFGVLGGLWVALAGGAGTFLAWGWLSTDHWSVRYNENILQLSPVSLPLVILLPLAMSRKYWAIKSAAVVAFAAASLSLLGLVLQILPSFDQSNGEIIALALPIHLAIASVLGSEWWLRPSTGGPQAKTLAKQRTIR